MTKTKNNGNTKNLNIISLYKVFIYQIQHSRWHMQFSCFVIWSSINMKQAFNLTPILFRNVHIHHMLRWHWILKLAYHSNFLYIYANVVQFWSVIIETIAVIICATWVLSLSLSPCLLICCCCVIHVNRTVICCEFSQRDWAEKAYEFFPECFSTIANNVECNEDVNKIGPTNYY